MTARNLRAINIFGSKVANAHRYPPPEHETIVEPFAGGAGYSLLHWRHRVILVDADPLIAGVWRYLISTDPADVERLPTIAPGQDVGDLDCCEGGRLLISWCINQTATPCRKLSSWGVYHTGRACYWGPARRTQAALIAAHVKHWQMFRGNYDQAPDGEATWFVDPPYQDGGRAYRCHVLDYPSLALWCRARRGQVIVCERRGADWLPFRPLYQAPSAHPQRGTRKRCAEALWSNKPARQLTLTPEGSAC
jgi:hypothetical protein